jgi:hypothetical protein
MTLKKRSFLLLLALILLGVLFTRSFDSPPEPVVETLSSQLTDDEFWRLVTDLSEPDGYFRSDNLLSNEIWFQYVVPELTSTAKPGRVYLGVGPEQNFTYISALRPKMAFIIDVRRGNLDLQLMYKALFELSEDRIDFISKLFSIERPDGLDSSSTIQQIFDAYLATRSSKVLYQKNLEAIQNHLIKAHNLPLSSEDLAGIEYVYNNFYEFGPRINYSSSRSNGFGGFGGFGRVTYSDLMTANDGQGNTRSFLATEENFEFMKQLESRNMLVPVVGNFGGPKAIRAVAGYLTEKGATVSAFYLSNVEQYLRQDGIWNDFCRNVRMLPLDSTSTFIRSVRDRQFGFGRGLNSELGSISRDTLTCTLTGGAY